MGLLKKLASWLSPAPVDTAYWVTVRCNRCGEIIRARVNLSNDLSVDYEPDGASGYTCHKVLMGSGHCFQRVEVDLVFNADRSLRQRSIAGGQFVEE